MSHRTQVGRARDTTNAIATPRKIGGGGDILCITSPCLDVTDTPVLVGPIAATWANGFQRVFVSATVTGVNTGDEGPGPEEPFDWTFAFDRPGPTGEFETWTSGVYTVPNDGYLTHLAWSGAGQGSVRNVVERKRGDGDWTPMVRPRAYPPGGTGEDFDGNPEVLNSFVWPGGHEYLAGDQLRCVLRSGQQYDETYEPQNDFTFTATLRNLDGLTASNATVNTWTLSDQTTWTVVFNYNAAAVPDHGVLSSDFGAYGIYTPPHPGVSLNCRVTAASWSSTSTDEFGNTGFYASNEPGPMTGPLIDLVVPGGSMSAISQSVGYACMVRTFNGDSAATGTYIFTLVDDVETAGTNTTIPMDVPS